MANTEKNESDLLASFPDNTTGEITAQNMRDLVVSSVLRLEPKADADLDMQNHKIKNLDVPVDDNDALRLVDLNGAVPDIANVRNGTTYGVGGSTKTGICHVPTASQVLSPVAVDNTTGNVTLPDAQYVNTAAPHYGPNSGTAGTCHVPTTAQVLNGVAVAQSTGIAPTVLTSPTGGYNGDTADDGTYLYKKASGTWSGSYKLINNLTINPIAPCGIDLTNLDDNVALTLNIANPWDIGISTNTTTMVISNVFGYANIVLGGSYNIGGYSPFPSPSCPNLTDLTFTASYGSWGTNNNFSFYGCALTSQSIYNVLYQAYAAIGLVSHLPVVIDISNGRNAVTVAPTDITVTTGISAGSYAYIGAMINAFDNYPYFQFTDGDSNLWQIYYNTSNADWELAIVTGGVPDAVNYYSSPTILNDTGWTGNGSYVDSPTTSASWVNYITTQYMVDVLTLEFITVTHN